MLRRILRVPPTHIARSWTNQKVIDILTERYGYVQLGHVLRAPPNDPMREVLFEAGTNLPMAAHTRRVGKPRANWLLETYNDAFYLVDCHTPFDINNRMHLNILAERAQAREPPFATKQWNTQHWPEDFIEFVTEYLIESHLRVPPNSLAPLSMPNE